MDGSPSAVLTMGLGSWGSSGLLLSLGFGIDEGEEGTPVDGWQAPARSVIWRAPARSVIWQSPERGVIWEAEER
jgi:hypothetical protein